jgi:hypothetical protein
MITLIAAAALAAQSAPVADAHAQHQQQGQAAHQMMDSKMMADCKKCCEEMEAKHAAAASEHGEHAHQ